MEIRNNLALVGVEYNDSMKKVTLTFLDAEEKKVRTVNLNKQVYDEKKKGYVDDADKAERMENVVQEYFGVAFDQLADCEGVCKDIYVYDSFNSLYPVEMTEKFTKDMVGDIIQTTIKDIILGDYAIKIRYEYDGKTYESKHTFGKYVESMKEWFVDPNKQDSVWKKFKDKYGVAPEEAQTLIGHPIMVEVKCAMGKYYYGDIKKFPKK